MKEDIVMDSRDGYWRWIVSRWPVEECVRDCVAWCVVLWLVVKGGAQVARTVDIKTALLGRLSCSVNGWKDAWSERQN